MEQACWDEMAANGGDTDLTMQALEHILRVQGIPVGSAEAQGLRGQCIAGIQAFFTGAGRPGGQRLRSARGPLARRVSVVLRVGRALVGAVLGVVGGFRRFRFTREKAP